MRKSLQFVNENKFTPKIPDEPKIRLNNYLLDLVSKTDKKENSIYLKNVGNFIKEIWNELVKNRKKLNVREFIPRELGVSASVFYGYKNNRKAISIQMLYKLLVLWKRYCNKSDKELRQKWDEIFNSNIYFVTHSRRQPTILPKAITPKLCYLVGWLVGDGNFQETHSYVVKISEKNKDQLELVLKLLIKDLFGINVPVFVGYGNNYRIQFGNKPIFRFLRKILKIKVGEIPEWVKNLDPINKRFFLSGIFDSEGSVMKNRNRLVISQARLSFLKDVIKLLNEFGIIPNGPTFHKSKLGEWYDIRIDSKKEFLKFAKFVGSNHIYKSKLIQMWVRKIEKSWSR